MEFLLDVITWSLGWVIFYPENNGWWDVGWFVVIGDRVVLEIVFNING